MDINIRFRVKYTETRNCVKARDVPGALAGCFALSDLCKEQLEFQGNSTMLISSMMAYRDTFLEFAKFLKGDKAFNRGMLKFFNVTIVESPSEKSEELKPAEQKSPDEDAIMDLIKGFKGYDGNENPVGDKETGSDDKANDDIIKEIVKSFSVVDDEDRADETEDVESADDEVSEVVEAIDEETDNIQKPNQNDPSNVSAREEAFSPETLCEFIGQKKVIERIQAEIKAAKKQGISTLPHILLLGSKGLGKTTLMELTAKEIGVKFEYLDCTMFRNDVSSQRELLSFLQNISNYNEPVVIGMDEIHRMPERLQSSLLTLLNSGMFTYLDKTGTNHKITIKDLTFIGATTHPQDLIDTLKDRCVKLELEFYDNDELQKIFLGKFATLKLEITEEALMECIDRCRSSLREVNFIAKGIKTYAVNANLVLADLKLTHEYFKVADLAPLGLKAMDLKILNTLSEDASGILAEDAIAARVGLDTRVYSNEYEPYLERIGFIIRTGRGRSLTDQARMYIKDGKYNLGVSTNESSKNKLI